MDRFDTVYIYRAIIVVSQALLLGTSVGFAHEEKSAAEIAAELSNPTAAVTGLSINFNFTEYDGNLPDADNHRGWNYLFTVTPVISVPWAN